MRSILFFLLLGVTSVSNAAFNVNECQTANWYQIGHQDGRNGQKIDKLYQYTKKCDAAGKSFSADLYRVGREEGLYVYCNNKNAFNYGFKGTRISDDICNSEMFPEFAQYYNNGKDYYKLQKDHFALTQKAEKLRVNVQKLQDLETEIKGLDDKMAGIEFNPKMEKTMINKSQLVLNAEKSTMITPDGGSREPAESVNADGRLFNEPKAETKTVKKKTETKKR